MNENELNALVSRVVGEVKKASATEPMVRSLETITLSLAKRLAAEIESEAERIGVKAVVVIADNSGRPILCEVMDDAFIASYDVALQKAFTVTALKMSTIDLKPLAQPGGSLYGIQLTNASHIVIFGGGEPLKLGGRVVGGLGVSGGSEAEDTALAAFGARTFEKLVSEFTSL